MGVAPESQGSELLSTNTPTGEPFQAPGYQDSASREDHPEEMAQSLLRGLAKCPTADFL